MYEHLKNPTSAVFKHREDANISHNINDIFRFDLLHNNLKYEQKRMIVESLYIKKYHYSLINACGGVHVHHNL